MLPEFKDAIKRGVILDVAHGMSGFSFEIAKIGIQKNLIPDIISTDLSTMTLHSTVYDLVTVMSKFLALGLSLEKIIEKVTLNPAKVLNEGKKRGSLELNTLAYISRLELKQQKIIFEDGNAGNKLAGEFILKPICCLKPENMIIKVIPSSKI